MTTKTPKIRVTAFIILTGLISVASAAPITISNPSFETGNLDGWLSSGQAAAINWNGTPPGGGNYNAFLSYVGGWGLIWQNVGTLQANTDYTLSFYGASAYWEPSAQLLANFSAFNTNSNTGTTLAQQVLSVTANGTTSNWTQYSLYLPASLISTSFSSWIGMDLSLNFGTANGVPVVVDLVSLDATVFGPYWAPAIGGGGTGTWSAANANWASAAGTQGNGIQSPTGTLLFGATAGTVTVSGGVNVAAGMTFSTDGYTVTNSTITLTGANAASNTITAAASIGTTISSQLAGSNGMTKAGSGTLVLSGNNSYTGGTLISNGTLSISADTNLGAVPAWPSPGNVTFGVGKLLVTESFTLNSNRGLAMGAFGGTIEVAAGKSFAYEGIAAGAGGLTKSGNGTLTLSGANTYTGGTTVSSGTLNLNATGGGTLSGTSSVAVSTGATLLISQSHQVNNSAAVTLSGGTITRGAGVSEVFGSLNLTAASFLDFGTGATGSMTFGTYEENTTPSALLTVLNFLPGNSFTFSNAQFAADGSNIGSYFTFGTGYINSSILDNGGSSFTITAIPEPSTVLAALGLTCLMFWPARRRLLRVAMGSR